jgi:hypothetical protein
VAARLQTRRRATASRHTTASKGKDGKKKGKQPDGKNNSSSTYEDIDCTHCGKHGHRWKVCRKRLAEERKAHAVEQGPVVGTTATPGTASEANVYYDEEDDAAWAFGANYMCEPCVAAGTILIDSGSDEHLCSSEFADGCPETGRRVPAINSVTGTPLATGSYRSVPLLVGEGAAQRPADAEMLVADVHGPVLSAGKLVRSGYVVHLEAGSSYLERNGQRIGLQMKRNTFHIPAEVRAWEQVTLIDGFKH